MKYNLLVKLQPLLCRCDSFLHQPQYRKTPSWLFGRCLSAWNTMMTTKKMSPLSSRGMSAQLCCQCNAGQTAGRWHLHTVHNFTCAWETRMMSSGLGLPFWAGGLAKRCWMPVWDKRSKTHSHTQACPRVAARLLFMWDWLQTDSSAATFCYLLRLYGFFFMNSISIWPRPTSPTPYDIFASVCVSVFVMKNKYISIKRLIPGSKFEINHPGQFRGKEGNFPGGTSNRDR